MPDIAEINTLAIADIVKFKGTTLDVGDKVIGISKAASGGTATSYLSENFDSLTEGYNAAYVPTNWDMALTNVIFGTTNPDRYWEPESGYTPSSTTGPYRAHGGSNTSGAFSNSGTSHKYMYTEVSGQSNKNFLLRTSELDFSNALSNNTLKLTFWFHMGSHTNYDDFGDLMVGTSNSSTSAADGTIGTGFTAYAGTQTSTGMSIEYWDDDSDDGSSTSTGISISGRQQDCYQTSTNVCNYWRKATVDLNSVAGESSCYIWFFSRSGSSYRGDLSIDTVSITGEE